MYLHIKELLPLYFDQGRKQTSEIWGKDLRFNKGEFIKIVAPSGSGKTSLMHYLYGLRRDYSGTISYGEERLDSLGVEDFANYRSKQISIVLQDLRLFPDQNVFDNINIKRQLNPYHGPEKIREMTERLGIGSKLNSRCGICSYGEQQRVAIIRSLMQPFDFLLLDEPFSHLDNNNSKVAMELMLEEAKARGAAIVFADLERIDYFPFSKIFHL
jgi:ABC-type lipoprotein export system ATPase subunit